ncbi:MAG: hypothetical protein ACYCZY_09270 [Lacisediminihabitans sp.]
MDGDHGMVLLTGGKNLRESVDRFNAGSPRLFPEVQNRIHVRRMEIPDPPTCHVNNSSIETQRSGQGAEPALVCCSRLTQATRGRDERAVIEALISLTKGISYMQLSHSAPRGACKPCGDEKEGEELAAEQGLDACRVTQEDRVGLSDGLEEEEVVPGGREQAGEEFSL